MKILVILFLLAIPLLQAKGQTFSDCSNAYRDAFKKIQLQRTLKEVDEKGADSVVAAMGEFFDSCIIGKEIPDYYLVGLSGKIYTSESLKDKLVVFNFWSVNCGPCVLEIPVLNRIFLSYKDNTDFVFISILVDNEEELLKFLEKGLTKRKIFYEIIPDSDAIVKSTFMPVTTFPTNLFIDREGKIFMRTVGGIIDSKDEHTLEAKLRTIIDTELIKNSKVR